MMNFPLRDHSFYWGSSVLIIFAIVKLYYQSDYGDGEPNEIITSRKIIKIVNKRRSNNCLRQKKINSRNKPRKESNKL